jgi:hypothetical protein
VNIERVRKYFTKQGWKALKALIIEKNDNLIWGRMFDNISTAAANKLSITIFSRIDNMITYASTFEKDVAFVST